jgi:predicted dithiol-disulfide oxidoreductase (DUF899 family)
MDPTTTTALPPVADAAEWRRQLDELRVREKAATRELDAIAAQRRRLPMVELPDYVLQGQDGPVRLVDLFEGRTQLITYHHMWAPGEHWQCPGCTGYTAQFTRLDFLDAYDARFVIVTQGEIGEALAARSAPTSMPLRAVGSPSTCSCATETRSTARGTRTDAAPSSSRTPFR